MLNSLNPFNFEIYLQNLNIFMSTLFIFLKYIFAGILLLLGTISLLRLKGIYTKERIHNPHINKSYFFQNSRFIIGNIYLILGIGFIFNFMIYALILMFGLIPDMLIVPLLSSINSIPQDFINDFFINNNLETPFQIFVYNIIGLVSFMIFLSIILSIWFLINNRDFNMSKPIISLIFGLVAGFLVSFSRFLPFFL